MNSLTPASPRPEEAPRRKLAGLDAEEVRYRLEQTLLERIRSYEPFDRLAEGMLAAFDGPRIRRELMASSLRLTESMAPEAHRLAAEARELLGVEGQLEIFQSRGLENAAMHHHREPILLEIQGPLLSLLDEASMLGVFGHELGHHLAHGPDSEVGRLALAARSLARAGQLPTDIAELAGRLAVAGELTADRFGLLAAQDLDAMLRLEMVATTGPSADALTWDTDAYLAQCRERMEACLEGADETLSTSHPEHGLRAYAIWLFSETREYQALTGRGEGTRSLAEVDALLDRLLDGPELELALGPLDAPPPELHECALAGSVLVAHADGELSGEELEVLERVFGPLVADWQAYLEVDYARERFAEAARVLRGAAPESLRALFALLTHVMAADGLVDEREVGTILAIGQHLECAPLFERSMVATLRTLGVDLRLVDAVPPPIPLPARRDDVLEALDAFIDGIERRGGGAISGRRLARLVGRNELGPEVLRAIEGALASRGVTTRPSLSGLAIEDTLELFPKPRAEAAEPAEPPEVAASTTALLRGLTRLRDQLVSGDGRSPSVRLRAARPGRSFDLFALEEVSTGMAERVLAQVQAQRQARLVDAAEAGTHRGAEACVKALLELDRTHRDRLEETGSNELYLGHLFLSGAVGQDSSIAGYPVRAPLVLYPVDLVRDGRGARGFRLCPRKDEPPIANQSLLRLVFNKKRFAFPDALSEELDALVADPSTGGEALLAKLRELGLDARRTPGPLVAFEAREALDERALALRVEENAVLGLFPQSSSDLLQDYDALLDELSRPSVDLDAVFASARLLLPADFRADGAEVEAEGCAGPPLIVADPAQREVLDQCRKSLGVVVDGPPGTGKSQVIVNLVLDAVRRGERVAVVCEKRAALDVVYQRVEALGLSHALALVHDAHEDRKPLYAQIARRIEEFEPFALDHDAASAVEAGHAEATATLEAHAALLRARVEGEGLTAGQLYALQSSVAQTPEDRVDALEPGASRIGALARRDLEELLGLLPALHPLVDFWGPESPYRSPEGSQARRSLAALDGSALEALKEALARARDRAEAYEAALGGATVSPDALDRAAPILAADRALRPLRAEPEGAGVYRAALEAEGGRDAAEALEAAQIEVERAAPALARFPEPVSLPVTAELESSVAIMRRLSGRLWRFFVLGWWLARRVVAATVRSGWPEQAGAPLDAAFLERFHARMAASKAWGAARRALASFGAAGYLPRAAEALASRLSAAVRLRGHASLVQRSARELAAVGLGSPASAELARWDTEVAERLRWVEALDELRAALEPVRPYFPWLEDAPSPRVLDELERGFERDGLRLVDADVQMDQVFRIDEGLAPFLDALARMPKPSIERWRRATLRAWAAGKLAALETREPAFARLGAPEEDEAVERASKRLAELESARSEIEIERVLARLDAAPFLNVAPAEKRKRRTPEQATREEILKEVRKKRCVMALRTFIRRFASRGLLDVLPVWLLSPETMTILFPREPLFDLVVFDEASQCTVESGLPVLLRARRVVIAGDEKQMPPTSFFQLGASGDAEDDDDVEAGRGGRDMLEAESLLTLARTRLCHAGLRWHYRCHDESLIAFSNHAMYGGGLHTIPSTRSRGAESALRWVQVPDGAYDGGSNEPEARRVVELLHELLEHEAPPTVGVVTFNLQQRRSILEAVERRVAEDAAFAALWNAALSRERIDERPFVKNLESVQGDERDVIVFSLGHAPVPRKRKNGATDRYVPARFGPLGQRGGERRLNVAISRAKLGCYVVSSFDPELLSAAGAQHQGPKLFRDYLEFVHAMSNGQRAQAERVLDRVRELGPGRRRAARDLPLADYLPLSTQVALALEALGVPYDLDVGASGFRVPVAIFDPEDPHRYALAVLVDEGDERPSAFEAFVHRPAVLRARGWDVMHLSAASWARRREGIIEAICERVPGARGALDSEVWRAHRARALAPAASAPASTEAAPTAAGAGRGRGPADAAGSPGRGPAWAAQIEDGRFRRALLELAEKGRLTAKEVVGIVGGPRRERLFQERMDAWRAVLPFEVVLEGEEPERAYRVREAVA